MNESKQPTPEDKLISALKASDEQAFKQVYRQAYALVETLIVRNSGTAEDAQDVFQEVLFVLVKNLQKPDFKLTSALNTYLYAIARNIWKNRLRREKPRVEFKDTLHDVPDPAESENEIIEMFDKRLDIVLQALKQLSDRCREIIVSFYYDKKSMREIGEAMQLAEAGVRVQRHRCMKYLTDKIKEHPDYRDIK